MVLKQHQQSSSTASSHSMQHTHRQQRYNFRTKPVAKAAAVVGGSHRYVSYRFTVLTSGLIRYEYASDHVFEDRASSFAVFRDLPLADFNLVEYDSSLEIITDRFHLYYDKKEFSSKGLRVHVKGAGVWRFGEKTETLGGTTRTLDGINGRTSLGDGVIGRNGFAEVDDSHSMLFTKDGFIGGRRPVKKEHSLRIDGYLFAYGLDYKAAIRAFYEVSGRQPLLPRWTLGNWWSRYYDYTDKTYLTLVDRFKEEGIPLSVGVLDIGWHWVNDKRVKDAGFSGWTGYSWNTRFFPKPKEFLSELHKRKLYVTANDHPADGIANYEDVYPKVCKFLGKDPEKKENIPFDITSEDYVDLYFDIVLKNIEDDGLDFWWQDWQQGTTSPIPNVDPLWPLNHFHFRSNYRKGNRPLIFSRFAGPGSQRYPIGFSGDSVISWASLHFQPEFNATASNIGFGWWSNDIGGHMWGSRDDELTTRWIQLGCWSPLLRLHSSASPFIHKEPWEFPIEYRHPQTNALRFRHRLIPYLYSMNIHSADTQTSLPLVQPLYWNFPEHEEAYQYRNTSYFGSQLLIAPVTQKRDHVTSRAPTTTWLPPKRWVDIFSSFVYSGNRTITLYRTIEEYAVFASEGSILPLDAAEHPENGAQNPETLEIVVVVGDDGHFKLHEDDGTGQNLAETKLFTTTLEFDQKIGRFSIIPPSKKPYGVVPEKRSWKVRFIALSKEAHASSQILVDGANGPETGYVHTSSHDASAFLITIDNVEVDKRIDVDVGPDPQLRLNDPNTASFKIIDEAQIDYGLKDRIWNALKDSSLTWSEKVKRVEEMGLDENLLGALIEVLVADSRIVDASVGVPL
ncbi:MAG: hypothetical protein M1820_006903 [Bogoriella megaspora]|nr:MAG: hypothetical protein M1820_006903 [Bogoriella megaspora]